MGTELTGGDLRQMFQDFAHTAFRLELQRQYKEPSEAETVARFLAGEPELPTERPSFRSWAERIHTAVERGKRIERVRVHDKPPTDYQRWERWAGQWNIAAGETIRYMTRARAYEVDLLPAAGTMDWWLFDSSRLVQMHFDQEGTRLRTELVDDPHVVVQAGMWRDLAVHFSVPDTAGEAAA